MNSLLILAVKVALVVVHTVTINLWWEVHLSERDTSADCCFSFFSLSSSLSVAENTGFLRKLFFSLQVWEIYFNSVGKIITWLTEPYWCALDKHHLFGSAVDCIWCVESTGWVLGSFFFFLLLKWNVSVDETRTQNDPRSFYILY